MPKRTEGMQLEWEHNRDQRRSADAILAAAAAAIDAVLGDEAAVDKPSEDRRRKSSPSLAEAHTLCTMHWNRAVPVLYPYQPLLDHHSRLEGGVGATRRARRQLEVALERAETIRLVAGARAKGASERAALELAATKLGIVSQSFLGAYNAARRHWSSRPRPPPGECDFTYQLAGADAAQENVVDWIGAMVRGARGEEWSQRWRSNSDPMLLRRIDEFASRYGIGEDRLSDWTGGGRETAWDRPTRLEVLSTLCAIHMFATTCGRTKPKSNRAGYVIACADIYFRTRRERESFACEITDEVAAADWIMNLPAAQPELVDLLLDHIVEAHSADPTRTFPGVTITQSDRPPSGKSTRIAKKDRRKTDRTADREQ